MGNFTSSWHGKRSRSWIQRTSVAAAVATMLAGPQANALGLGEIRVFSHLDEPLIAEISLLSPQPGEMRNLRVGLGSFADFEQADIERTRLLRQLEFEVLDHTVAPVVRVTSKENFSTPYLHFLITAEWSGGKHVKEYTALLDPLLYDPEQYRAPSDSGLIATGSDEIAEPLSAEIYAEPLKESPGESLQAPPRVTFTPVLADSSLFRQLAAGGAEYGPTAEGDTLWNVAALFRASGSDLNLFKIMMALYIENPGAFHENNMHLLKVGELLVLANVNATAEIPLDSASLMFNTHYAEWQDILARLSSGEMQSLSVETQPSSIEMQPSTVAMQPSGETDLAPVVETPEPSFVQAGVSDIPVDTPVQTEAVDTASVSAVTFTPDLGYKGLADRVDRLADQVNKNTQQLAEIRKALALAGMMIGEVDAVGATTVTPTETDAVDVGEAAGASVAVTETVVETTPTQPAMGAESVTGTDSTVSAADQTTDQAAGVNEVQPSASEQTIAASEIPETASEQVVVTTGSSAEQTVVSSEPDAAQTVVAVDVPDDESAASKIGSALFRNAWWMSLLAIVVLAFAWFFRNRRHSDDLYDEIYVDATDHARSRSIKQALADQQSEDVEAVRAASTIDTGYYTPDEGSAAKERKPAEGENEQELQAQPSSPFTWTLDKDFYVPGLVADESLRPDPLTEAELYLAYDQHELAEKVLLKAIAEKPEDKLKERLLEIYKERNDVKGIKAITRELYDDEGEDASIEPFADSDQLTIDRPEADQTEIEILRERLESLEKALAARDNENQELQEEIWAMEGRAQQMAAANESSPELEADFEIEIEDVDELKIGSTDSDSGAMQENIQSMKEALAYRENENRELQERVDTLENQVLEMTSQLVDPDDDDKSKTTSPRGIKGVV